MCVYREFSEIGHMYTAISDVKKEELVVLEKDGMIISFHGCEFIVNCKKGQASCI